jgi:phage baseplate assembly protein W
MMTLALVAGDFVLSAGTYATFSGSDKIQQDLSLALNEDYGSDTYHPYWGSILNRYIGAPLTPGIKSAVSIEVQRILKNYIAAQADAASTDIASNTRGSFNTSDIVQKVESIDVVVAYDSINITVVLQTMSRQTVTIKKQIIA